MIDGIQTYNEMNLICLEDDKLLKEFLIEAGVSSRLMVKLKKERSIYVNDKMENIKYILKKNDRVKIKMIDEKNNFDKEDIDINILYEDYDLLIVEKKPFIVVHPTKSHPNGTIGNAIAYYMDQKNEDIKIRFINRLDMNTSGLLIVGKNPFSQHVLSQDMANDRIEKEYITIVHGDVKDDEGTINKPIYRESDESIKRIVDERGQESITHYKVIERLNGATLLRIKLETGRTHQIRVHMQNMGHPIVGDELYGTKDQELIDRQALHAIELKIFQPRTKECLVIESPIPLDMQNLIEHFKR